MDIRQITPEFAVSPQISVEDVSTIAAAGFCLIISNRPDNEEAAQPSSMSIEQAALDAGMGYEHIPIAGGAFGDRDIERFYEALQSAEGLVLAYCKSGTRAAKLWALSHVLLLPIDDILSRTQSAGYDLSGFRDVLEQRHEKLTGG